MGDVTMQGVQCNAMRCDVMRCDRNLIENAIMGQRSIARSCSTRCKMQSQWKRSRSEFTVAPVVPDNGGNKSLFYSSCVGKVR